MTRSRFQFCKFLGLGCLAFSISPLASAAPDALEIEDGSHIVLIGNNLGSRMMNFGPFETELQLRNPGKHLFIRNMCDPGDTPGFRPRASRNSPWAFPGAEKFQDELANYSDSQGHFPSPDEWLAHLKADIIIAFFGYSESFNGKEGLEAYEGELGAFIDHTLAQMYNGASVPQLALLSPIAFEDLVNKQDLPDGVEINANLSLYAGAMKKVAQEKGILFIDVFGPSKEWLEEEGPLTIDGSQLTDAGYDRFANFLADAAFGPSEVKAEEHRQIVHDAVMEKNWMWRNDYKIPNSVHVYGRRYNPFGPDNYPAEIAKIREMTTLRDRAIWAALEGDELDLATADLETRSLPVVQTNFDMDLNGRPSYLYGQAALDTMHTAPGYRIELFASEEEFPDLANPAQLSFDNEGRLWVAVVPSYPHYKPGDRKPNDKLIILEDTDHDGKADRQKTFVDGLHLPMGFELAPEGVYVSQGTNLKLYADTDGDDKADSETILLSGFDDHDTHHVHSAYEADPSGAIYMGEGVFLHTNVETSYGPVRGTNGGFYRYNPARHQLERTAQINIPNPWGIIFDEWGQNFYAETSSPDVRWMMPSTIKPIYGVYSPKSRNLIEESQRVRPTAGLEFVSSRHFPDEVQGDLLINNTIGFLGMKQHTMVGNGTGYHSEYRQDLVWGDDFNFRPVDMEFAPDGSLYLVDWHNVLVGHMQHNARDPLRDHVHGRIYRITYPSRPLVEPAKVAGASIEQLLDNLKLPEYRTRYRTRRELRGRNAGEVTAALDAWIAQLDEGDGRHEHHLLEALWVTWGLDHVDGSLLRQLLQSDSYRVRAAAVRVLRYTGDQVSDQADLLMQAASDEHGRVRLEAIVAASWLDGEVGVPIVEEAGRHPLDEWMMDSYETAVAHLQGRSLVESKQELVETNLKGNERDLFLAGKEIYSRDGYCVTCHQPDGGGLSASGYPPIAGTNWVNGSDERLIKVVLKGLYGPFELMGKAYSGQVPMTPFGGMLTDEEVASVLTYVRTSFGNEGPAVAPEKVKEVRAAIEGKEGFYSPAELLEQHPMEE